VDVIVHTAQLRRRRLAVTGRRQNKSNKERLNNLHAEVPPIRKSRNPSTSAEPRAGRCVEQRRRRFRWCDLSESWTIDVGGAVGKSRLCELRVIEDVKEIQAQFQD